MEEVFWTIVTFVFVFGTLGIVAYALARMFGFGHEEHRIQH